MHIGHPTIADRIAKLKIKDRICDANARRIAQRIRRETRTSPTRPGRN